MSPASQSSNAALTTSTFSCDTAYSGAEIGEGTVAVPIEGELHDLA